MGCLKLETGDFLTVEKTGVEQVEVYFDDFKVTHVKSPVIQSDSYYPFGLTFNSYSRESSIPNRWKFQGQEHIDDLDLNWDSFKWRNHQPEIGRFFNVDPLAESYYYNSPYAFSENRVVDGVELEGLEWKSIKTLNNDGSRNVHFNVHFKVKNSSSMTTEQIQQYSQQIASQAESSFRGTDSENNTTYSTKATFEIDNNAGKGDFYIEFVKNGELINMRTGKPYPVSFEVQGAVNQEGGNTQENRTQIQDKADNIVRTGTHELGHTGGLKDPDRNSNRTKDLDGIPINKDNLMQQSQTGSGVQINIQQLRKIEKTIDDDTKKKN